MKKERLSTDRSDSEGLLETRVSPKITVGWYNIATTCNCGRTVILRPLHHWMVADCECGRNIRMNEDRTRMIIDFNKVVIA